MIIEIGSHLMFGIIVMAGAYAFGKVIDMIIEA